MNSTLLKQWSIMFGCDVHKGLTAPVGIPIVPLQPHLVLAPLKWFIWGVMTGQSATSVESEGSEVLHRGTDIGSFIPHVSLPPTNLLMPLIILFSGSKSEFAANTVYACDKPVAVSVLWNFNLNLNCSGPACPPLPSGLVYAPNTVVAGFTFGDFLGGLAALVIDSAIQFGLNRIFGSKLATKIFGKFTDKLGNLMAGKFAPGLLKLIVPQNQKLATAFINSGIAVLKSPYAAASIQELPSSFVAFAFGSPVGASMSNLIPGFPSVVGDNAGDLSSGTNDVIANYFNSPEVEQHP